MMEQTKTQMSVIFPTEPTKVHIHPLPKGAEMITYSVADTLWIKAWMPDGYKTISQESVNTNDDFYNEFCDDCNRNCYSFLDEYADDESGEVDWNHPDLVNHCNVYDNGYNGQTCPVGNVLEKTTTEFTLAPMVFGVSLQHLKDEYCPKFSVIEDTAYLSFGYEGEDGENGVWMTSPRMASNVYGNSYDIGKICWGRNSTPQSLKSIVENYFSTPFNDDLTPIRSFEYNSTETRYDIHNGEYELNDRIKVLCNASPDALMLMDASKDICAFFQLLSAGFKSLPEAPHVMMIPLFESTINKNGCAFDGYVTPVDDVDKQWFVTRDGLIAGQV